MAYSRVASQIVVFDLLEHVLYVYIVGIGVIGLFTEGAFSEKAASSLLDLLVQDFELRMFQAVHARHVFLARCVVRSTELKSYRLRDESISREQIVRRVISMHFLCQWVRLWEEIFTFR